MTQILISSCQRTTARFPGEELKWLGAAGASKLSTKCDYIRGSAVLSHGLSAPTGLPSSQRNPLSIRSSARPSD